MTTPFYENDQQFPNFYGVATNSLFDTPGGDENECGCADDCPDCIYKYRYPSRYPAHINQHDGQVQINAYNIRGGGENLSSMNKCRCGGTVFTPKKYSCGPLYDPYCPSGQGTVGGLDTYGIPICVCPHSGRQYTLPVLDKHSVSQRVQPYFAGPFLKPN